MTVGGVYCLHINIKPMLLFTNQRLWPIHSGSRPEHLLWHTRQVSGAFRKILTTMLVPQYIINVLPFL